MKKVLTGNIKYKFALIITILGLIGLLSGTSYAILRGDTASEKEQVIKAGSVILKLTEKFDNIATKVSPLSDADGLLQDTTYDFSLKNIGDVSTQFDIKLINEVPSNYTGNVLDTEYVKIGLEINSEEHGPFSLSEVNNIIDSGIINKNEIINYKLRIWLDEEKQEELANMEDYKSFLKLKVEAVQDAYEGALDKSGANPPILSKNMIAVYYDEACNSDEGCWKKADNSNEKKVYQWYDYDSKMWANSVTVSEENRKTYLEAEFGTEIKMEDILTMQVWIPRYKYTVWNYNSDGTVTSEPQEIDITFESGTTTTGEIGCTDNIQGTSDGTSSGTQPTTSETCKIKSNNETCMNETCNGKTYTHPAFTFGEDDLTGFWVGKFEVSSDIDCSPETNSDIEEGCNLSNIRPLVIPDVPSWNGAMVSIFENNMMAMNDSGNKYGFITSDDTHMIKNMEWGAVAYLSHSKYGTCTDGECTEVALNSESSLTTGCGPQALGSMGSGSTCNAYNTVLGQSSSTTGNIYGIYDMSGGAYDCVMGNIVSPDGETMMSGYTALANSYSGYTGIVYYGSSSGDYTSVTGTYEYPDNKYYDKYSFNTSSSTRGSSKLGDAIKEVYENSSYGWYSDYSFLAYCRHPWFNRGGSSGASVAGVFYSYYNYGYANPSHSSRLVISLTN